VLDHVIATTTFDSDDELQTTEPEEVSEHKNIGLLSKLEEDETQIDSSVSQNSKSRSKDLFDILWENSLLSEKMNNIRKFIGRYLDDTGKFRFE
jgi:hypothetical protein